MSHHLHAYINGLTDDGSLVFFLWIFPSSACVTSTSYLGFPNRCVGYWVDGVSLWMNLGSFSVIGDVYDDYLTHIHNKKVLEHWTHWGRKLEGIQKMVQVILEMRWEEGLEAVKEIQEKKQWIRWINNAWQTKTYRYHHSLFCRYLPVSETQTGLDTKWTGGGFSRPCDGNEPSSRWRLSRLESATETWASPCTRMQTGSVRGARSREVSRRDDG